MEPPTIKLQPQLTGDCEKIPEDLVYPADTPESHKIAFELLGSAARIEGLWVAVSLQAAATAMGISSIPVSVSNSISPANWMEQCWDETFVCDFRDAADASLVYFDNGYAYPTQEMADILLGMR